MGKTKKRLLIFVIVFFCVGISLALEAGESQEYEVENYHIIAEIDREGDFIITEEIHYNFLSGEFSNAYREEPGKTFSALEFISLEGLGTTVRDYQVSDGSSLDISWEYPLESNQAGFTLQYWARDGLQSKNGRNILDWQVVGRDWGVPIREADITILFPEAVRDLNVSRGIDDYEVVGNRLTFQKSDIMPGEGLRLQLDFQEQVAVSGATTVSDYFLWLIFVAILAIIIAGNRIYKAYHIMNPPELYSENRLSNAREMLSEHDFDFLEKVYFAFSGGGDAHRGMAALVFDLVRKNRLSMKIKTKKKFLGEDTEIHISLPDEEVKGKEKYEKLEDLFDLLADKGKMKLKDLIGMTSIWEGIMKKVPEKESILDFISEERKDVKDSTLAVCLVFFLLAGGSFLYFVLSDFVVTVVPTVLFTLIALGELIRYLILDPLNDNGLRIKKIITEKMDRRRETLEQNAENDPKAALKIIFYELPWLLIDAQIDTGKFNRIREEIKENITEEEMEEINIPAWIASDGLQGALQALESVDESIATITAVVATTSTTSAGGGGTGCGGGGAG